MEHYFNIVRNQEDILIIPQANEEEDAIVILSLKEYNSIIETGYLLSNAANRKHLEESVNELREGKTIPYKLED